jgi:hypothetical protein
METEKVSADWIPDVDETVQVTVLPPGASVLGPVQVDVHPSPVSCGLVEYGKGEALGLLIPTDTV